VETLRKGGGSFRRELRWKVLSCPLVLTHDEGGRVILAISATEREGNVRGVDKGMPLPAPREGQEAATVFNDNGVNAALIRGLNQGRGF